MNFKKIITLNILLTVFSNYLFCSSSAGSRFIQPLSTQYLPRVSTQPLLTSSAFGKYRIPRTSQRFTPINTTALAPITRNFQFEIKNSITDMKTLHVKDPNWIRQQLQKFNQLYNQHIKDYLEGSPYYNRASAGKDLLLNLINIQVNLKDKLKDLNDIKEGLEKNNENADDINTYISITQNSIKSLKQLLQYLTTEPIELLSSPEINNRIASIIEESTSPDELTNNLWTLLASAEYKQAKNSYEEQSRHARLEKMYPDREFTRSYDESYHTPYAGLGENFRRTVGRGAALAGLTTEEYMRRNWKQQQAEQKSQKKDLLPRTNDTDFGY